jgi:hypothetical protein
MVFEFSIPQTIAKLEEVRIAHAPRISLLGRPYAAFSYLTPRDCQLIAARSRPDACKQVRF